MNNSLDERFDTGRCQRRAGVVWQTVAGLLLGCLIAGANAASLLATTSDKSGMPLPDVVIYLEPLGTAPLILPPPPDVVVAQQGMQFVPYLTTVRVGTKITFPNRDNVEHHVKSFSEANEFELKIYSSGTPPPIAFDSVGVVGLNCLLHDWMRGFIYVVDTPYYANTDEHGAASVLNVPEGKYEVRAWHPDMSTYIPPLTQTITLGPGANTISFAFDFKPRKRKAPHPV